MRRVLFASWLIGSIAFLLVVGGLLHPPVAQFGSPSSLLVIALWSVGVVPASFTFWFRQARARERAAVERALSDWRKGIPGAGAELVRALELVLAEEDEESLRQFLEVLGQAPPPLEPAVRPFLQEAKAWLADDHGASSRAEHLERVKVAFRQLGPQLEG